MEERNLCKLGSMCSGRISFAKSIRLLLCCMLSLLAVQQDGVITVTRSVYSDCISFLAKIIGVWYTLPLLTDQKNDVVHSKRVAYP
jgi:hypothetical protein